MSIIFMLLSIILIFMIIEFNIFITLKNKIKHSKSTIEVYLTQRFDLIPNLVECVKGYANYEKETLQAIIKLRELYNSNKDLHTAEELGIKMNNLLMRTEDNADLKADDQFIYLQKSLIKMESQLQSARRIYNGDITLYNTTIETIPNNIFAYIFKMKPLDLFTIEEYKAQNIEVKI